MTAVSKELILCIPIDKAPYVQRYDSFRSGFDSLYVPNVTAASPQDVRGSDDSFPIIC